MLGRLLAAGAAPPADGRAIVIATGTSEAALTDVPSNGVVAQAGEDVVFAEVGDEVGPDRESVRR